MHTACAWATCCQRAHVRIETVFASRFQSGLMRILARPWHARPHSIQLPVLFPAPVALCFHTLCRASPGGQPTRAWPLAPRPARPATQAHLGLARLPPSLTKLSPACPQFSESWLWHFSVRSTFDSPSVISALLDLPTQIGSSLLAKVRGHAPRLSLSPRGHCWSICLHSCSSSILSLLFLRALVPSPALPFSLAIVYFKAMFCNRDPLGIDRSSAQNK